MDDEIVANPRSIVDIELSEFDSHPFNVSLALKAIFKKHEKGGKSSKIVFHVKSTEDIDKMFCVMEGLERWIVQGSELPEYILENIPNEVQFTDGTAPFWPRNWVTNIEMMCRMKRGMHAILETLYDLPNVERFAVSNVEDELPLLRTSIGKLKKLKCLSLQFSYETGLPPILRFCKELEELHLCSNRFSFLPFWVTKLNKLHKLSRLGNPLVYGVLPYHSIARRVAGNTNTEAQNSNDNAKKKLASPRSLFFLAATTALVEFPHLLLALGENTLDIPRHVYNDIVSLAPMIKFCDQCNQAFFNGDYLVLRKTFKNFKGYRNIPFEAVLCSDVCADELYSQWVMIADDEKIDDDDEDNLTDDNSNSLEIIHFPTNDSRRQYSSREKVVNFLRRALCCCS